MQAFKISVKFFLSEGAALAAQRAGGVFQTWIQREAIPEHQLIDVAEYQHVSGGPGTVLVAHEGNFSLDQEQAAGVLYQRKQPLPGTGAERIRQTLRFALLACELLEQDPELVGKVRVATHRPLLRIHDRLLAPNNEATFAQVRDQATPLLTRAYGGGVRLEHVGSAEELFGVRILAPTGVGVTTLLKRLSTP